MNLWCPKCNGTTFYYKPIDKPAGSSDTIEDELILMDEMKCRNRNCNYEFKIQWYTYVREQWLKDARSRRPGRSYTRTDDN